MMYMLENDFVIEKDFVGMEFEDCIREIEELGAWGTVGVINGPLPYEVKIATCEDNVVSVFHAKYDKEFNEHVMSDKHIHILPEHKYTIIDNMSKLIYDLNMSVNNNGNCIFDGLQTVSYMVNAVDTEEHNILALEDIIRCPYRKYTYADGVMKTCSLKYSPITRAGIMYNNTASDICEYEGNTFTGSHIFSRELIHEKYRDRLEYMDAKIHSQDNKSYITFEHGYINGLSEFVECEDSTKYECAYNKIVSVHRWYVTESTRSSTGCIMQETEKHYTADYILESCNEYSYNTETNSADHHDVVFSAHRKTSYDYGVICTECTSEYNSLSYRKSDNNTDGYLSFALLTNKIVVRDSGEITSDVDSIGGMKSLKYDLTYEFETELTRACPDMYRLMYDYIDVCITSGKIL